MSVSTLRANAGQRDTGGRPRGAPGDGLAVSANDPLRSDLAASSEFEPARHALSAVVYAERDDEILLLQRADGSAMAGQWFLSCGFVEAGELPEEGARRELALVDEVESAQPDAVIWDTTARGKPDLARLAVDAVEEFGAEAVFVVSSKSTTIGLAHDLECRGIPAFGPIWDS